MTFHHSSLATLLKSKPQAKRIAELRHKEAERRAKLKAEVDTWFKQYDFNQDGILQRDELAALLTFLSPDRPPTEGNLDFLIEKATAIDTYSMHLPGNKNGSVTWHNARTTVHKYHEYCRDQDYLDSVFARFDADGNGTLDATELPGLLAAVAPEGRVVRSSDVHYILQQCDDKGDDGVISRDEVMPMLARWKRISVLDIPPPRDWRDSRDSLERKTSLVMSGLSRHSFKRLTRRVSIMVKGLFGIHTEQAVDVVPRVFGTVRTNHVLHASSANSSSIQHSVESKVDSDESSEAGKADTEDEGARRWAFKDVPRNAARERLAKEGTVRRFEGLAMGQQSRVDVTPDKVDDRVVELLAADLDEGGLKERPLNQLLLKDLETPVRMNALKQRVTPVQTRITPHHTRAMAQDQDWLTACEVFGYM